MTLDHLGDNTGRPEIKGMMPMLRRCGNCGNEYTSGDCISVPERCPSCSGMARPPAITVEDLERVDAARREALKEKKQMVKHIEGWQAEGSPRVYDTQEEAQAFQITELLLQITKVLPTEEGNNDKSEQCIRGLGRVGVDLNAILERLDAVAHNRCECCGGEIRHGSSDLQCMDCSHQHDRALFAKIPPDKIIGGEELGHGARVARTTIPGESSNHD